MQKYHLLLKVITVALCLAVSAFSQTRCQLQSARIFNGFSLGMLANSWKYTDVDSWYRYTDSVFTYNVFKQTHSSGYLYYFRNGIRNRAEISYTGFILPIFGALIELGLKVKTIEYGEPLLFKNITVSLQGNIFRSNEEWSEELEMWGGVIISTLHRFQNVEMEIVMEPFYSNCKKNTDWDSDGFEKRIESFNLSSGFVTRLDFNPDNRFSVDIKMGFSWQHIYDSHYHVYHDYYSYSPMKVDRKILLHSDELLNENNFGGNASIAFNWLKRRRS